MSDANGPQAFIDATMESGRAFATRRFDGPLVMLNLMKFRDVADYSAAPHLASETPVSGLTAYETYMALTLPFLKRYEGEVLFYGVGGPYLIGPAGRSWDRVLLVRQNSVASMLAFATDAAYGEVLKHRAAALADSRVLPVDQLPLPV